MKAFIFILALGFTAFSPEVLSATPISVNDLFSGQEGGAVGNGGGTIVCRDRSKRIKSVEVLDLFEARVLRGIQLDLATVSGNWKQKVQTQIDRLGRLSQLRQQLYSEWLGTFEAESMVLKGVTFNHIPDSMSIGVPAGCEFEQAAVQIVPRFPSDRRYYLNDELWSVMDDTQKAALVMHELVYREALSYGHTDSVATRYVVGVLNSNQVTQMDETAFVRLLDLAHFEQTDITLSDSGIETEFDPLHLWRLLPHQSKDLQKRFQFKGKMVVNIGKCKNVGCTDWENFENPYVGGIFQNCNGLTEVRLPGVSASIRFERVNEPGQCQSAIEVVESSNLWISFASSDPSHETVSYDGNFAHRIEFYQEGSGYWRSQQISSLIKEKIVSGFFSDSNCLFDLSFEKGKVSQVKLSGLNSPTSCKRHQLNAGLGDRDLYLRLDLEDSIQIDAAGNYGKGGKLMALGIKRALPTLICSDDLTCMDWVNSVVTDFTHIRIYQSKGKLRTPYYGSGDYPQGPTGLCEIADGVYELHSTMIPKWVTVRGECSLVDQQKKAAIYPAGSVLQLDEQGYVLNGI